MRDDAISHGDRAHATLGASGAHRWIHCPGSVALIESLPVGDTSSSYAEEGTAAHELAQTCLEAQEDAASAIGGEFNGFEVDQEMADFVQQYLDYVRSKPGKLLIESRVDFGDYVPDGFGTADAIVIDDDGHAFVIDLKYGKGVRVDADENPQLKCYGLGALQTFGFLYDIEHLTLVVVQPRMDHVSEFEISADDLIAWGEGELAEAARLAREPDAPCIPGESQCRFCDAKGLCKALKDQSEAIAIEGFGAIEEPFQVRGVDLMDAEEMAAVLPRLGLITSWAKAVEDAAVEMIKRGEAIDGYKLVKGLKNQKYVDEDAAGKALARKIGSKEAFVKKLISPAQARDAIAATLEGPTKKARQEAAKADPFMKKHVHRPEGGPVLALASDPKPALEFNPTEGFGPIEDDNTQDGESEK